MSALGVDSDQLVDQRRAFFHYYGFPVKKTFLPSNISPGLHSEDGGYAVDSCVRVEWDYYGWCTPSGPLVGRTTDRVECRKSHFGSWICPRGNVHEVIGTTSASTVLGVYVSGQEVPLTRRDYSGLFSPPPPSPALQAALLVGQSSYQDHVVLPTVYNICPMTRAAQVWLADASEEIRDTFLIGIETIYYQTGVCLQGPVAEVDNAQLLILMRELNVNLPAGVDEQTFLHYIDKLKEETSRQFGEGTPRLISTIVSPVSLSKRASLSPSKLIPEDSIPDMDIFLLSGPTALRNSLLQPIQSLVVPPRSPEAYIGWTEASASVREWMSYVHDCAINGGILTQCSIPEEIVTHDVHVWHKEDRPDISTERRLRGRVVFILSGTGDPAYERFVNAESFRMIHAGARFPTECPVLTPFPPIAPRVRNRREWSTVSWKLDIQEKFGAPSLREGKIVMHPRYSSFCPDNVLTLVYEKKPFPFSPGSRLAPGSVNFIQDSREVKYDSFFGDVHYPDRAVVDTAIAIDPEGCELRDDAFEIRRVHGGAYQIDAYTLSVARHADLRRIVTGLPPQSRYYDGHVLPMLPELFLGLSCVRGSYCHHHRLVVSDSDYTYEYRGITTVKLERIYTYQEAFVNRGSKNIAALLDATHKLMTARPSLNSNIGLHNEWSSVRGATSCARENPVHEAIQEISLAVGLGISDRLPIKVMTVARGPLPHYVSNIEARIDRRFGRDWRKDFFLLPIHWRAVLRAVYIRNGGAKKFTSSSAPHKHIHFTLPYARICSPGRQKDCLLNDMFLNGQIDADFAVAHIDQLNDGVSVERQDRQREDLLRLRDHLPLGPMVVVDASRGRDLVLLSLARLVEIPVPQVLLTFGTGAVGINFMLDNATPSTCWVGVGDVIYFSGVVNEGGIYTVRFVRKLRDSRDG